VGFLCLSFLGGCENTFEPSGFNHIELEHPDPPEGSINLTSAASLLNYEITEPTSFSFTIDVPGLTVYESRVQIHDQLLFQAEAASGYFIVNPNTIPDGEHLLIIESLTNSGTGSLAEHFGVEGFNYLYEVPLSSTGNAPLETFSFSGTALDSGGLRIFWDQSKRNLFEEYVISSIRELYRTTSVEDTSFIEPNYIGGNMNYSMSVKIAGQVFSNIQLSLNTPLPIVSSFDQLADHAVQIHWTQCAYPDNLKYYRLDGFGRNLGEIVDVSDTTLTVTNVAFGSVFNTKIYTKSRFPSLSSAYDQYSHEIPVWVGDSTGVLFEQAAYDRGLNRLVVEHQTSYQGNHAIEFIDAETLEQLAIGYSGFHNRPAISPTGKQVVVIDDDYLKIYNMSTLEVTNTIDLKTLLGQVVRVYGATVSDEGDLFVVALLGESNPTLFLSTFPLTDPEHVISIAILDGVQYPYTIKCTPDGRYIAHNYTLYSFINQELTAIDQRFYAYSLVFDPLQERMVAWNTSGQVQIWDLPPQNIQHSLNLGSQLHAPSIDPISGKLGARTWDDGKYQIINLETGTVEIQIPVNAYDFLLYNNKILSEYGFRIPAFE